MTWVEAETEDGTVLSSPTAHKVMPPAVLEPVHDLRVATVADGAEFELSWTSPPGTQVRVYRTPERPPLVDTDLGDESALPLAGLPKECWLKHPSRTGPDGRTVMAHVSWPEGWTSAYFTPVTTMGGPLRIGRRSPWCASCRCGTRGSSSAPTGRW